MKLADELINESKLSALAMEAVHELQEGSFGSFAEKFGYALSYERDVSIAIQEDLQQSLFEIQSNQSAFALGQISTAVKFFQPSKSGLIAVVECQVSLNNGAAVLIELIISANGDEKHLTLEQISAAA